jgi:tetratricopeptide (TPR) repeat protein
MCDLHVRRGEVYEKLERWDEAAADFSRALDLAPSAWNRWHTRAKQYEQAERWDAALALYSKLIQQQQEEADPGVRVQYAELLAAVGLWKEAAELFLSAAGTSGGMRPHPCYLRVLVYVVTGAQERAAEVQETLLEQFADREDDHQRLYSLLRGLTITPVTVLEADDLQKLADQVDRESVGRAAWGSFLIGLTHYRLGQYQEALDRLSEIPAPLPWFRPLFAMVHSQLGDEGEARRYLEEADAWYEQAVVDHLVGEDVKLPVEFWFDWPYFVVMRREAARVVEGCDEWKDPWHHLIRGRVLLRMDEPEKAEQEFQAALAAQPDNRPALAALLERARYYAIQGQWQEASADFLKAAEPIMNDD